MAKQKGYDTSIRDRLAIANWGEVWPRVVKFARAKELMWRKFGVKLGYLEIIQKAISRIYGVESGGKYRNWDFRRYPDLAFFLRFVIKDVIRDEIAKLADHSSEKLFRKDGSERDMGFVEEGADILGIFTRKSVEQVIIDEEEAKELLDILHEISETDSDLGLVVLCLEDGVRKRSEIAEITGFTRERVYSLLQKIQRKVKMRYPKITEIPFLERRVR